MSMPIIYGFSTVDRFLPCSDFFTIDVADDIGSLPTEDEIASFVAKFSHLQGKLEIARGLVLQITGEDLQMVARKYFKAVHAGARYLSLHFRSQRGRLDCRGVDGRDRHSQSPKELLLILAALADKVCISKRSRRSLPVDSIKGVDYVGDVSQFEREFRDDILVLAYVRSTLGCRIISS